MEQRALNRRQTQEQQECYVGNDILACYPNEGDKVLQDRYGRLIWNHNYPEFTNRNGYIDIYLFHEDNDKLVRSWKHVENAEGRLAFMPQDSWWQGRPAADNFNGTNIAWPFYFVITYAGRGLEGGVSRLATWDAIQTALPLEVAASRASAATATLPTASSLPAPTPAPTALPSDYAAFESSMFAANVTSALLSSLSAANASATRLVMTTASTTFPDGLIATATATAKANGQLPGSFDGNSGKDFPDWAIALIVVLGVVTLIALVVGWYFCIAAVRRRTGLTERRNHYDDASIVDSNTPMIEARSTTYDKTDRSEALDLASPTLGEEHRDEFVSVAAGDSGRADRYRNPEHVSQQRSLSQQHEETSGMSSNEAWRLANAFRAALRRPRFGPRSSVIEGADTSQEFSIGVKNTSFAPSTRANPASTDEEDDVPERNEDAHDPIEALIRDELADEGREMRYVEERRRTEVYTAP